MLHLKTMGWRDRDYGKWTDEERRRFYGSGSGTAGSSPNAFGGYGSSRPATRTGLIRPGVGLAILVSGAIFALGHFPASHPILPFLHFRLPASHGSVSPIQPTGTINTPSTATLGSTLTFNGTAPPGSGPVTVEGSYDGGRTWQTLSTVESANGSYAAPVTLSQRGPLQIQIVFSDGSKAAGFINVT